MKPLVVPGSFTIFYHWVSLVLPSVIMEKLIKSTTAIWQLVRFRLESFCSIFADLHNKSREMSKNLNLS